MKYDMSVYPIELPINYNWVNRMNVDYSAIGQRVKACRKTRGMTQEQLSEALSVSVGYISQIERGVTRVSLDTLCAIAGHLGCDPGVLVSGAAFAQEQYLDRDLALYVGRMDPRQKRMLLDMARLILNY